MGSSDPGSNSYKKPKRLEILNDFAETNWCTGVFSCFQETRWNSKQLKRHHSIGQISLLQTSLNHNHSSVRIRLLQFISQEDIHLVINAEKRKRFTMAVLPASRHRKNSDVLLWRMRIPQSRLVIVVIYAVWFKAFAASQSRVLN